MGGETFFAKRAVSWHGGGASPSAADVATLKLDHAAIDAEREELRAAVS